MNTLQSVTKFLVSSAPALAPAFLLGLACSTALAITIIGLTRFNSEGVPKYVWQAQLFAGGLSLIVLAIMGIGKAFELLTEGWIAVVGICTALLGVAGLAAVPQLFKARNGKGSEVETK